MNKVQANKLNYLFGEVGKVIEEGGVTEAEKVILVSRFIEVLGFKKNENKEQRKMD